MRRTRLLEGGMAALLAAMIASGCGRITGRPGGAEAGGDAVPASLPTSPPQASKSAATTMKAPAFPYAVTYAGDIPCADCPLIHMTLTLFPDATFRLRRDYRGAVAAGREAFVDLGRRVVATEGDESLLVLQGSDDQPLRLRALQPDRLRLLDPDGREIASPLNYDLTLQPSVDRIQGPMRLRGLYTSMADAAVFEECVTGKKFPVLPVGAGRALQSAYLAARHAPGKPVLIRLEGQFVERAPEPGQPVREHLIVERPGAVGPGTTCAGR
jgi:copper homeostasis protein (lipoprotein)